MVEVIKAGKDDFHVGPTILVEARPRKTTWRSSPPGHFAKFCWLSLARLAFVLANPSNAFAHQLDEYVQATLVSIEPGSIRLRINLTPGIAVAEQVLDLLDRNHDGIISTNEAVTYAQLLKRDLTLRLDGRPLELRLADSFFPQPVELRTGLAIIQLEFSASPARLTAGSHELTIENRHLPKSSAYLVNAAQPKSERLQITTQKRNHNQSVSTIGFILDHDRMSADSRLDRGLQSLASHGSDPPVR